MPAASAALAASKPQGRSRISNGSAYLPSGDGRSVWARLARDTFAALVSHCGGELTETRRMMARRAAGLEAELVHLEDQFAKARAAGSAPDAAQLDLYSRLSNTQRRLAESLGWERTARDCTPTLAAYLASHAAEPVRGDPNANAVDSSTHDPETLSDAAPNGKQPYLKHKPSGAGSPAAPDTGGGDCRPESGTPPPPSPSPAPPPTSSPPPPSSPASSSGSEFGA